MSAILLSTDGTHKVIDVKEKIDFKDVYDLIDCQTIEVVKVRDIDERYDLELLVDEEGLFKTENSPSAYLGGHGSETYIVGASLLVKYDKVDDKFVGLTSDETAFMTNALTCNRVKIMAVSPQVTLEGEEPTYFEIPLLTSN